MPLYSGKVKYLLNSFVAVLFSDRWKILFIAYFEGNSVYAFDNTKEQHLIIEKFDLSIKEKHVRLLKGNIKNH